LFELRNVFRRNLNGLATIYLIFAVVLPPPEHWNQKSLFKMLLKIVCSAFCICIKVRDAKSRKDLKAKVKCKL